MRVILRLAPLVFSLILISVLLTSFANPVFAQAQNAAQGQSDSWLRIYPKHVYGIYVKAEDYRHDAPIKPESVVVALTDESEWPGLVPKTGLVGFVSGKAESGQGCMFIVDRNGLDTRPPRDASPDIKEAGLDQDVCGHFRVRIAKQLMPQAKACARYDEYQYMEWTLRTDPIGWHRLFVSRDLRQVRCLANLVPIWVYPADQSGMAARNEIQIEGDDRV